MISTALSPSPLIRRRRAVAVSDRLAFFYILSFDFSENHQTVVYVYILFVSSSSHYYIHVILNICFFFTTFFSI